jgi:hypothetical protein
MTKVYWLVKYPVGNNYFFVDGADYLDPKNRVELGTMEREVVGFLRNTLDSKRHSLIHLVDIPESFRRDILDFLKDTKIDYSLEESVKS